MLKTVCKLKEVRNRQKMHVEPSRLLPVCLRCAAKNNRVCDVSSQRTMTLERKNGRMNINDMFSSFVDFRTWTF